MIDNLEGLYIKKGEFMKIKLCTVEVCEGKKGIECNSKFTKCELAKVINHEEIILALEKQIPKKPNKMSYKPLIDDGWEYECPTCTLAVGINSKDINVTGKDPYCPSCGQKIEWD